MTCHRPGAKATALLALLFMGAVVMLAATWPAKDAKAQEGEALGLYVPQYSAQRGRKLFVQKGCVVCHSVNNVGGKAGPSFDAPNTIEYVDVLEFAARMWNGSYAMTQLQGREFGYQIQFTGQEIADLAAFVYDAKAQAGFSKFEIPELLRDWTIDDLDLFLNEDKP